VLQWGGFERGRLSRLQAGALAGFVFGVFFWSAGSPSAAPDTPAEPRLAPPVRLQSEHIPERTSTLLERDARPGLPVTDAVPAVDTADRWAVVDLFFDYYLTSEGFAHGWTGDVAGCVAGVVNADYHAATLRRINYFRAMAGLPGDVVLDAAKNAMCQEAALMMSANGALSHNPPNNWTCYTANGDQAAGVSNLAAGFSSAWRAIDGYMSDANQPEVGHRRWILYPRLVTSGLGATFGGSWNGYAMWVIGDWGTRPATPEWVSWPPPGYVPYQVVYELWSFTLGGADFSSASVSVTRDGVPVESSPFVMTPGYGDPGLSWSVDEFPMGPPPIDRVYSVTVNDVLVGGSLRDFTYDVRVFSPEFVVGVTPDDSEPNTEPETEAVPANGRLFVRSEPNPFALRTAIRFYVPEEATVVVDIYNVAGRRVRRLHDAPMSIGWHTVDWDGSNASGVRLAGGVYFARVVSERETTTQRLLLTP